MPLVIVMLVSLAAPACGQDQDIERFRNILMNYFLPLHYIPVLVNRGYQVGDRGYQVGDVIDTDGVNVYARASRCFPSLQPEPPASTFLEDVLETDSAALTFGLRPRQIFDSSAGADLVRRIRIKFTDVKVATVSRLELQSALDRTKCPEIAPVVDATAAKDNQIEPGVSNADARSKPPDFGRRNRGVADTPNETPMTTCSKTGRSRCQPIPAPGSQRIGRACSSSFGASRANARALAQRHRPIGDRIGGADAFGVPPAVGSPSGVFRG